MVDTAREYQDYRYCRNYIAAHKRKPVVKSAHFVVVNDICSLMAANQKLAYCFARFSSYKSSDHTVLCVLSPYKL